MTIQNFLGGAWTEEDTGGYLTVTSPEVAFNSLPRDELAYVVKNQPIDGNFEYLFDAQVTAYTGALGIVGLITIADTLGAIVDYIDASEYFLSVQIFKDGGESFILREREGATINQDFTSGETGGIRYYYAFKFNLEVGSFGQLTLRRYTDVERTSLFHTLSINLTKTAPLSKLQVAVSRNDPTITDTITGDIRNLDLQEVSIIQKFAGIFGLGKLGRR